MLPKQCRTVAVHKHICFQRCVLVYVSACNSLGLNTLGFPTLTPWFGWMCRRCWEIQCSQHWRWGVSWRGHSKLPGMSVPYKSDSALDVIPLFTDTQKEGLFCFKLPRKVSTQAPIWHNNKERSYENTWYNSAIKQHFKLTTCRNTYYWVEKKSTINELAYIALHKMLLNVKSCHKKRRDWQAIAHSPGKNMICPP